MRAQKEHTYESTHMKAHILSTHMKAQRRAHISEHSGEHTYEPAQPQRRGTGHKSHFVWKFTGKMPNPTPTTSIEHRAFDPYRKNPFSVATLFGE